MKTKKKPNELKRIYSAFLNSIEGLKIAFKQESAIRTETFILVLSIILTFFYLEEIWKKLLLIGSVIFLMIIELLNSAIETTVDRISKDYHDLSKIAKDISSSAVFLTIILVSIIWIFLFIY